MNKIKVAIAGLGGRGRNTFGQMALDNPDMVEVVAVSDIDDVKLKEAAKVFNVPEERCFGDVADLLKKERLADVYNITNHDAQIQVTEYIINTQPIEKSAAGVRIDIRFNLFERLTERTWRCEWLEETRERGILQNQVVKSGTFTYTQNYPQTQLQAEYNPSGIFFTEFFVTERR